MRDTEKERSSVSNGDGEPVPLEAIPLHSTNLLTVLDEAGIIAYESPAIERIYGFDQDELVGEQVLDYVHPDDRNRVGEAFRAVVTSETQTIEAVEYRHEQADGSYQWVESVSSSNATPGGGYIVNSRGVSERKTRERNLERRNDRLDRFVRVISHDLRNPLNVARLRLDLARESCDDPHLEDVERAHDRMETLIEELLALARSGAQIEEIEPIDLPEFVEGCWRNVSTADATLVTESGRSIRADRSRLAQLFENVLRNAVEHCSAEPGTATVTVGTIEDGFYIADDGHGIPDDQRADVFETGHTTKRNGTGLGLAIVKEIVEAHGWEIDIAESAAGGARFEITGVEFA